MVNLRKYGHILSFALFGKTINNPQMADYSSFKMVLQYLYKQHYTVQHEIFAGVIFGRFVIFSFFQRLADFNLEEHHSN